MLTKYKQPHKNNSINLYVKILSHPGRVNPEGQLDFRFLKTFHLLLTE